MLELTRPLSPEARKALSESTTAGHWLTLPFGTTDRTTSELSDIFSAVGGLRQDPLAWRFGALGGQRAAGEWADEVKTAVLKADRAALAVNG